jgi:hypothetical protein
MAHQSLESLPVIGEQQIAALLNWEPLIDAMENALKEFSAGEVVQPVRQIIPVPGRDGLKRTLNRTETSLSVRSTIGAAERRLSQSLQDPGDKTRTKPRRFLRRIHTRTTSRKLACLQELHA